MAENFSASGFLYKNNISADIAAVDFAGFLNIYHVNPPLFVALFS